MQFQGRITDWRDSKGFGFITPNGGGERVFVHIQTFTRGSRRPALEDRVIYTVETDNQGRLRASSVEFVVRGKAPPSGKRANPILLGVAGAFVTLVVALALTGRLPQFMGIVYPAMSVATFTAYALDKSAARADRWRIPEGTLHLLGLLGGWPGGLLAQQLLRHKSKKASFLVTFWIAAAVNVSALFWLLSPSGKAFVRSFTGGNG